MFKGKAIVDLNSDISSLWPFSSSTSEREELCDALPCRILACCSDQVKSFITTPAEQLAV